MAVAMRPVDGLHNGYDEEAAQRVEAQLVELGLKLGETRKVLSWLSGAFDEGPAAELLERIRSELNETEGHLPRLMCEARREMRGE